jgi:hypothetical protein
MEVDARIVQANGRLKSARVGISIEQAGNRLVTKVEARRVGALLDCKQFD